MRVPVMPTFEEVYCQRHECDKWKFRRDVFWKCLYPHAVPIALLLGGVSARCFDADRELIAGLAALRSQRGISEEVRDFFEHEANRRWTRRALRLRLSTSKVRRLARAYIEMRAVPVKDGPPAPAPNTDVHLA